MYCVFTTPSQVSFRLHLSPFALFYLPHPLFLWWSPYCCLCLSFVLFVLGVFLFVFCLIPSIFFSQSPNPPSLLTAVHLLSISRILSILFGSLWNCKIFRQFGILYVLNKSKGVFYLLFKIDLNPSSVVSALRIAADMSDEATKGASRFTSFLSSLSHTIRDLTNRS